jgi:single-stranded-DNA-specific exonuclease
MVAAPSFWKVAQPADPNQASALATHLSIPPELAALLIQRGVEDPTSAKTFLRPSLDSLADPSVFKDLPEAVKIITDAVRAGETILVHGDYDVDGQCATTLLTRVLRAAKANVVPFVPHRMRDGYDLGPAGVAEAVRVGAGLIVTCDCGVTANAVVADARQRGIKVVVTDHHLPGELPPANAVVNPRRPDCPSEAKELCGTGVIFKLVQALVPELGLPDNLPFHFLDLVALATVADIVPLVGENRTLVRFGLRLLSDSRWPGVRALVRVTSLAGREIRAGHVGFIVAPRLNAVGRIGAAMDGVRLLLSDDEDEAYQQALALEAINAQRQEVDQAILREAIKTVEDSIDLDRTFGLVLANEGWHPGVIGIVASRLVETYARPTILIGGDEPLGRGSGRSIPGFDLHAALAKCAPLLAKYGGHRMAAGLSIRRETIDAFRRRFNEVAQEELGVDDLVRTQRVDVLATVERLDMKLERLLRHFEPCGAGNPAPIFAVSNAWARRPKSVGERHLRFTLEDGTGRLTAIGFNLVNLVDTRWFEKPVDVAFRLEEDEWQGYTGLQARVVDLRPAR